MPTTTSGYRYPSGDSDSISLWLGIQALAEDMQRIGKATVANQTERLALVDPAQGLLVAEKDTRRIYLRNATGWDLVWQPKTPYASRSLLLMERQTFNVPSSSPPAYTRVTGWQVTHSSSAFSLNTQTGIVTCNRDGVLALNGYIYSDRFHPRHVGGRMRVPGGASAFPLEHINDNRQAPGGAGYPYGGLLRQPFSWSGRVQAGETTYIDITQSNDSGSGGSGLTDPFNAYFALEYLTDY